jgi:hypothetical protein
MLSVVYDECYAKCHLCLVAFILSVAIYAECHYGECCYTECD